MKHEYVDCPHAWPHSSFHRFVSERHYEQDWCCQCEGRSAAVMEFDDNAKLVSE